jgi:O-antigen/teichoic acid export membrane protein
VLGSASYGGWFFGLAMLFYAIGFIPGLGQAMLLGVHRNHLTILVQALIMPGVLLGVVLLIVTHGNGRWVVALPAASLAVVNLVTSVVASRVTRFSWRNMLRKLPWRRRYAGSRIRGIAGPRLVLSLTVPLALASDRLVLSHFATKEAVAQYGVCLQIFAPVTALIAAAAQPLWPIYVAAKAAGSVGPRVSRTVLAFSGATFAVCAALLPLSGPLGDVVGGGKVPLGLLLPFAAALMTVVFAAAYPVGVALTSPKELRFMAVLSVVALPLNLAFSIVLARSMGASGPLFATTGVGLAQTFAGVYYLRAHASDPPSWVGVGPDPTADAPDGLTAAPVDVQSWWSTNS